MQIVKIIKVVILEEIPNFDIFDERGEKWTQKALERLVLYAFYWSIGQNIKQESMQRFLS